MSRPDFKEAFFEKKESIVVRSSYMKLQQAYKKNEKSVFIFVENSDDFEFYRYSIAYIYRDYLIVKYFMLGKSNVLDMFHEIDWVKFQESRLLFFADKDYDDLIKVKMVSATNFFYTKHYSIENYVVSTETLSIVLERYFISMNDIIKNKLLTNFELAHNKFMSQVKTFTKFILLDREGPRKANLDEFKMSYFMRVEATELIHKKLVSSLLFDRIRGNTKASVSEKTSIRKESILDILKSRCEFQINDVTFNKLMQKLKLLNSIKNQKSYIRGKYELWFFIEFIKSIDHGIAKVYHADANGELAQYPRPHKKNFDILANNVFDFICPKMAHSDDIVIFLKKNFLKLNGHDQEHIQQ